MSRLIAEERQFSVNAISILEASYRMAGYDEEARRLRFLIRRASRGKAGEEPVRGLDRLRPEGRQRHNR